MDWKILFFGPIYLYCLPYGNKNKEFYNKMCSKKIN